MEEKFEFYPVDDLTDGEICLSLNETRPGDPERGFVPGYRLDICTVDGTKVGTCDLRVGHTKGLYYGGNIGYCVDEEYRGHGYAAKACRLMFKLAARHDMGYLYITCDPSNAASAATCRNAGASYIETVDLPPDNDMYLRGKRQVMVFHVTLS